MSKHGDQVLIVGGGPGGAAILDVFADEHLIKVAGMVDSNEHAEGVQHAMARNIPVFTDLEEALNSIGKCMVFNLTKDDSVSDFAARWVGSGGVIGGDEAKLFWKIMALS